MRMAENRRPLLSRASAPSVTSSPSLETFRPIRLLVRDGFRGRLLFRIRTLLDLQVLTIYRHLSQYLPNRPGSPVLDVGCGASPYRGLAEPRASRYVAVDIPEAVSFGYGDSADLAYDGCHLPFRSSVFGSVICTEVLEHVSDPQPLVDEIYRVIESGGSAVITVPWSARYHFAPHDYFRFTPSTLNRMFSNFSETQVVARGSDLSAVEAKLIVLWARHMLPRSLFGYLTLPFWLATLPVPLAGLVVAHVSFALGLGSQDDPLGYSVVAIK